LSAKCVIFSYLKNINRFLNVYDAKINEKSITAKRKTIFFIGKSPFCLPEEDVGA
jgi:hypothetical protein